jgi:hypothetical protein
LQQVVEPTQAIEPLLFGNEADGRLWPEANIRARNETRICYVFAL